MASLKRASKTSLLNTLRYAKQKEARHIFVVPKIFLHIFVGDYNAAVMLSQMLWWSDRTTDPNGWFYKSGKQWEEELFMTRHGVQTSLRRLESAGYIEVAYRLIDNGNRVCHYRVLEAPLMQDITDIEQQM